MNMDNLIYINQSRIDSYTFRFFISYLLTTSENCTSVHYYLFHKDIEALNNYVKVTFLKNYYNLIIVQENFPITKKIQKKLFKRLKTLGISTIIIIGVCFFFKIPKAVACRFMLANALSSSSFVEIISQNLQQKKEKKGYSFSKKLIVFGSLAVTIAIGAILYNRETISRVLFTPNWEHVPLSHYTPICYTLAEREMYNRLQKSGLPQNIHSNNQMLDQLLTSFGKNKFGLLISGALKIDKLNIEEVFTFVVGVWNHYSKMTSLGNEINQYLDYFDPKFVTEFKDITNLVGENLNKTILNNPTTLSLFQSYINQMINHLGKFDFNNEMQKDIVKNLVMAYLNKEN